MSTPSTTSSARNAPRVRAVAHTDIGRRREENQDSYGIIESAGCTLYFVCDGMGGVRGGALASQLAVATIKECLEESGSALAIDSLTRAVQEANIRIHKRGTEDHTLSGMGTTFVGVGFIGAEMLISSVGDSRAYRVRGNEVTQLTEDHTLVMELVRQGALSPDQASNHPVSHMLTRSLGPMSQVEVDCRISEEPPVKGDIIILCSDGLYNLVAPEEFVEIFQSCTLEDSVPELIELANLRGGTDNITVIAIAIEDGFPDNAPARAPAEASSTENGLSHLNPEASISLADTTKLDPPSDAPLEPTSTMSVQESGEGESLLSETDAAQSATIGASNFARAEQSTHRVAGAATANESDPPPAAKQDDHHEPVTTERIEQAHPRTPWISFFAVAVTAFGIGVVWNQVLVDSRVAPSSEVSSAPVRELVQVLAPENLIEPPVELPNTRGADQIERSGVRHAGAAIDDQLSDSELQRLISRSRALEARIEVLDERIQSFDRPLSGRSGQLLAETSKRAELLRAELASTRNEIDAASRRLALWFGRRKRLLTTDPINLATEVGSSVPSVQERKEAFERATWGYLKEAEILRVNPADKVAEARVAELMRERRERMRDLANEVRSSIDREVGDADRAITVMTVRRDEIERELDELRREAEYVRVLASDDAAARRAKQREFLKERQAALKELEELREIVRVAIRVADAVDTEFAPTRTEELLP